MKANIKQYAELFYELTADKNSGEIKGAIEKFVKLLARQGQLNKADKIIDSFSKVWNKKRGIVEAEAISARELDKEIVKLLHGYIVKLSGAKEIILAEKVDKKILGGVVIKYGDKVVDGSLKMRLVELKSSLNK